MTVHLHRRLAQRLRRAVDIRPGEARPAAAAFIYYFLLLAGYYLLRPVRDEMGIQGGIEELPWMFTATFVTMLVAVPAYGALVSRVPRRTFLPVVYLFFAVNLLGFYAFFTTELLPRMWLARIFFVWVSVYNLFVVSVFWSFLSDLFSNTQGRRLYGAIAAGGTTGALAGPAAAGALAPVLGPEHLLPATIAATLGCVWCIRILLRHPPPHIREGTAPCANNGANATVLGGSAFAGFKEVATSPYLLGIAAYILLYTVGSTFVYFAQAHIVEAASTDAGTRTFVFAAMDFGTNGLTLLLQLFIAGRLLQRFGALLALSILPAVTATGFLVLSLAPILGVLAGFQILRRATNYALARPGREVLFTVVPRSQRYKAKSFLDTVVYRGGDVVGGWAFAGLGTLGATTAMIAALGIPLAILWLAVGTHLGHREQRLRSARHTATAPPRT